MVVLLLLFVVATDTSESEKILIDEKDVTVIYEHGDGHLAIEWTPETRQFKKPGHKEETVSKKINVYVDGDFVDTFHSSSFQLSNLSPTVHTIMLIDRETGEERSFSIDI